MSDVGLSGPRGALPRDEAVARAPLGWGDLVTRAYDAIESVPGLSVGRVLQLHGRLRIECFSRVMPGHLVWRLAALERLSAHVCQVCGLRGRIVTVAEPIHWLVDEAHVLCAYHHWRELEGDTVEEMCEERLRVLRLAPDGVHQVLAGDSTQLTPVAFRNALLWLGTTIEAQDESAYVREHRIAWVLQQATADQLSDCRPTDLAPFFEWVDADVREATLRALGLLRN